MMQYKYTAVNKLKEKKKGYFIAESEEDLAVQLSKQDLYLVSAKPYTGKTPSAFFTLGTGKVKLAELTAFCRQYSIMLNSGVSLLGGLEVLKGQNFSSYFKSLLGIVYDDVKSGMMLSDALAKHKKVFPNFFHSMIKIGEQSGNLDEVMNSLADYYEKDNALKRKIRAAFAYPIMLLVMMVGIVILMLAFVIPTFREVLDSLEIEEQGLTKLIYGFSDFLLENWLYLIAGLVVLILILFLIGKTKNGRYFYDWLKVSFPGVKKVNINILTSKFARAFALLLSSGMDVNDALDAVVIVFGNKYIEKKALDEYYNVVKEQKDKIIIFKEAFKLDKPILTRILRRVSYISGNKYDLEMKHIFEIINLQNMDILLLSDYLGHNLVLMP